MRSLSLTLTQHTRAKNQGSRCQAITQPPASSSPEAWRFAPLRSASIGLDARLARVGQLDSPARVRLHRHDISRRTRFDRELREGGVGHDTHDFRSRLGIGPGKAGATPQPHCSCGVSHAGTRHGLVPPGYFWRFLEGLCHLEPFQASAGPDRHDQDRAPPPSVAKGNANDVTATPHLHHPAADLGMPSVDSRLSRLQPSILIVTFLTAYRIYYAMLPVFALGLLRLAGLALAGLAGE